jgi:hypothetical protein
MPGSRRSLGNRGTEMSSRSKSKESANEWRTVSYSRNGKPDHIGVELPANADPENEKEAIHFVQTLEDNQQIQHEPGPLKPGKTHQIETDDQGKKLLVRKRFSAI